MGVMNKLENDVSIATIAKDAKVAKITNKKN